MILIQLIYVIEDRRFHITDLIEEAFIYKISTISNIQKKKNPLDKDTYRKRFSPKSDSPARGRSGQSNYTMAHKTCENNVRGSTTTTCHRSRKIEHARKREKRGDRLASAAQRE